MDLGLAGKNFVVGGSSSGLGRAVAGALADEGARVLLVSRSAEKLEEAVAELGEGASYCAANLSEASGVEAVVAAAGERFGSVDGVLINAGGPPGGAALDLEDEAWLGAFEALILGPLRLLRALLPIMNEGASVLFVTSSSVRQPIPGLDASNVLRPGVAALAKTLARELGPRVRVNSLAPGRFDTARARWLDEQNAEKRGVAVEKVREATANSVPLGRYGDPAEFGRTAAFLLSPAASYVSGTSVQVDGSLVTAVP
jgi:3-oxoacyl-[acyl-carrier protein] reductase